MKTQIVMKRAPQAAPAEKKMSATIEHDKRKREILEKAVDVFSRDGFDDTTFQKIADRCGISRTILYIYFKDKRDIFRYAVKLAMESIERDMLTVGHDASRPVAERAAAIFDGIIESFIEKKTLLKVIYEYLLHAGKAGLDPQERVLRRTIRIRHHFSVLLNEGRANGELNPDFSGAAINALLYGLIETAAFRIAALDTTDVEELKAAARLALNGIKRG
jgi:AcrR family transcriptional regulator